MTEQTTRTLVHPGSGEVIDLENATTTELADGLERLGDFLQEVARFRQSVVDELAGRMDRQAERKVQVGDFELETNAPTSEEYLVDVLETELEDLVEADVVDEELLGKVIVYPPRPPAPAKRVDKREVNKLKKSSDRRILAAIVEARQVKTNTRTVRVTRIPEA